MIKAGGAITIHLEGDRNNRPSKKCENQSIMSSSPPLSLYFSLPALWLIILSVLSAPSSSHSLLLSLPIFLTSSLLCFFPHRSPIYIFLSTFPPRSFHVFSVSLVTIITSFGLIHLFLQLLYSVPYHHLLLSFITPLSTKRDY